LAINILAKKQYIYAMKKFLRALYIVSGILILSIHCGCKKNDDNTSPPGSNFLQNNQVHHDITPPIITLIGNNPVSSPLNSTYVDPGAIAIDDHDGNITPYMTVSGTVDNNLAGPYQISYMVSDSAGNTGTVMRIVYIENDADYLNGTYFTTQSPNQPWYQSITASSTINNRIIFSKFGNYSNNTAIYATVSGSSIILDSPQTAIGIGIDVCTHLFSQNGANSIPVNQVSGKWNFSISYTDEVLPGGSCSASSPVPLEDFFQQQ
jgi:surface protein with Ig-like domain